MFRTVLQRAAAMKSTPRSSLKQAIPIARRHYTSGKPSGGGAPSIPAMLAVASMGFAAYYTLVKSREGQGTYIK